MQPLNVPATKQPLPMALGAWSLPELLGAIAQRDATIEQQQCEIERLRERVEGQSELLAKTQQALLDERAIRRVAIARKNHLFFGSEAGGKAAAVFCSMLATCRANDVNPYEYLADVLGRINDHPINRIDELAPYNWKPSGVAGSASTVASTSSLPVAASATRH